MAADNSDSSAPGKVIGRPFVKGQSGNPGGKNPEREEMRRYAFSFTKESIDGLVELARHAENEKVRLDARVKLVEWGIGKPSICLADSDGNSLPVGIMVLPAETSES